MRTRGVLCAVAAMAALSAPAIAGAEPPPPPPPPPAPDIGGYALVKPSEYAVNDGSMYAFTAGEGITCVMSRANGSYGCSGPPFPGAPGGANVVTGAQIGAPGFAVAANPVYVGDKPALPLPANSRISFQHVTCGTDGALVTCQNSFDQSGFVVGPGCSWIVNPTNPLLDRPEGRNPYFN